jgi:hypothetical protein
MKFEGARERTKAKDGRAARLPTPPGLRHLHSPLFTQGMTHASGGLHGSLPKDGTGNKGLEGKTKK